MPAFTSEEGEFLSTQTLFFVILAAVLSGGFLLISFVWAAVKVGQRERTKESLGPYVWVMVLNLGFCAGSLYIAFGGT